MTVHREFEKQVQLRPNAAAVVYQNERLSYDSLNRRANQLARHLRERGVGHEVRVGICVERSLDLVVALLAVLKSGGCYVPLDPAYPEQRRAYILRNSEAAVLITQQSLNDNVPTFKGRIVNLDTDWHTIGLASDTDLQLRILGDQLAYIIYTSGSTGAPKGVQISHDALMNLLHSMRCQPGLEVQDTILAVTTISFDIAALELYLPLVMGAKVVLAPHDAVGDGKELIKLIDYSRVTVMQATPATWNLLVATGWRGAPRLKILCGGEALPMELAADLLKRTGQLWNMYGPTETTIWSARWRVGGGPIQLGQPIANTQLYILDERMELVAPGTPGELCIGGTGLARGYFGRSALTAEKFIPNPFCEPSTPGARLYRTGDLACLRPDGTLEFLGRIDHQVKLRGFRIELGEIEAVLDRHPAVQRAVVVAQSHDQGQRLVAYFVSAPGQQPNSTALRQHLRQHLPEYMIPSAWVVLPALPLTPNGKIDRAALAASEQLGASLDETEAYVAPRTPTETLLATMWAELLNQPRVGIHDNFFTLGGHSLLATRLVARLRAELPVDLPVRAIFEAPTIAELATRLDRAAPSEVSRRTLVPVVRDQPLPLAPVQQRLWILDHLLPDSSAYTMATAVHLQGPLDPAALHISITALVARHEVLRTTVILQDDQPLQQIHPPQSVPLSHVDLSAVPGPEQATVLHDQISAAAQIPFELSTGPLLRVMLFQLGVQHHVMLLVIHHIIFDDWSMHIFLQDLGALYHAQRRNMPAALPPLPIQYADVAHWQQAWLQGERLTQQLAYWTRQLAGVPPELMLPTDFPRSTEPGGSSETLTIPFTTTIHQQLMSLGREESVTPFMVLLAAWAALLSRLSGQQEVCIGTPIAGRTRSEMEGLIGCFVNTLVLRVDLGADPNFRQLLRQARATTLDAYSHQDVPFEQVVEAVQPARNLHRTPLFQVMLVLQNAPTASDGSMMLDDVQVTALEGVATPAKFDLTLVCVADETTLSGRLWFDPLLFAPATIERMAMQFVRLLSQVLAIPDTSLHDLSLVSAAERERFYAPALVLPAAPGITTRFEEQAARHGDHIAISDGQTRLTYAELNRRANQVAHTLRTRGLRSEQPVALAVRRSIHFVVGLLGILKAGGVYIPLDPAAPAARQHTLLSEAEVELVIREAAVGLPNQAVHIAELVLDTDPDLAVAPTANPQFLLAVTQLAYVIYTSGSTGLPKGVAVTHEALAAHLDTFQRAIELSPTDTVLQFAAYNFDVSIEQTLAPLLCGAQVFLRTEVVWSPADLTAVLAGEGISVLNLPPAYWHAWIDEERSRLTSASLPRLRLMIVGGEALPATAVALWQASTLAKVRLLNAYGPTETTITATLADICATDAEHGASGYLPIGQALPGRRAYVLDSGLNPMPVGASGELYLGGSGLARGYLRRPDLTAAAFVPDPFSTEPGARLYQTGDRVRIRPDDMLEFLGRMDEQVKLRGYRIEPGEIAAVLRQHAAVREAVVLVREDIPGLPKLVAYVVPHHEPDSSASAQSKPVASRMSPYSSTLISQLQDVARKKLPEYMVPAELVVLAALPLTPNGKLDRQSLPVPDGIGTTGETDSVIPRDRFELDLVHLWEEVLNTGPIGINDNFFHCGGHSLLAIRLIARIERQFGQKVSLAALFQAPTVQDLARLLRQKDCAGTWSPLVKIQATGTRRPIFCVHPVGGGVLCYLKLAEHLGTDQPFYGLQSPSLETQQLPATDIQEIAKSYIAAMRSIQSQGPFLLGGWSIGGVIAFEMAQQLQQDGHEVAVLALIDTTAPIPGETYLPADDLAELMFMAMELWRLHNKPFPIQREDLDLPTLDERLLLVLAMAQETDILPSDVDLEHMRQLLRVYSANIHAIQKYTPKVGSHNITLFQSAERLVVEQEMPALGWTAWSTGTVEVVTIPGDHYGIVSEPHVQILAEELSLRLTQT